ncbi:phosphotransferase [Sporosarcina sp. Te-1]|uniref:phosphotransferase n=1 Tax=Sporosarcina sp. Te-1 TaxID=2818390 RepID=UPI001A9E1A18|nr:phosphotransferase [Sporosarcina sp. Te-1]QTD41791.1 phosphotransferase [Sporosarcina sp. Te-1]
MESLLILRQFGFDVAEEQESIYPFSPVYKVDNKIVKRTQYPLERARNLVNYITYVRDAGAAIVTPVKLQISNPQQIDDDVYICYPFIEGTSYKGLNQEIKQAGELLGKIHSLSSQDNVYKLKTYDVFDFTYEEVDEHVKEIERYAGVYQVDTDIQRLRNLLYNAVENQEKLKKASLTWVETPHDYKANNLVYTDTPTLIDPDNATWIPRTFDVALALLLFHNELPSAPNRVFSPQEWQIFLNGYTAHQTFTKTERDMWEEVVYHVFLDEVMWLMAEVEGDWRRQEQRELFESLLHIIANQENYRI